MQARNLKLVPFEEIESFRNQCRAKKQRVVMTNGCFDLLHVGHVRYLQQAKALGDILWIGLNSDSSVKALKGEKRPLNNQEDRAEVLSALACVDWVTIFEEVRCDQLIRAIAPDIYAKGGDYKPDTLDPEELKALQQVGAEIKILPLVPGRSTTTLIQRMGA
ncbi:MAG: D-glycero-beta-D-manno-heptose 1-phosphate adenylyltransferase [Verrucomicrobiae bacterium]|nr:D-glycero-beta-D-manno-heptose 1-phosphate adenylyltransferase [Verrucomicrobiae bacterium]